MSAGLLRAVIFDMDGVLVDSHAAHRKAWKLFFQTLGRDVDDRALDFILDGPKRAEILRHFLGDCSPEELEEFGRRKDSIFRQVQLDMVPIPGVVPLVRALDRNRIILGLATSASRSRARSTLVGLGVLNCFQVVVTGEDVTAGKPDAAVYRLACQQIGLDASHLLAVEDAISGVRAAVAAGLHCVGVALHETPERLSAAGAVHVVRDFKSTTRDDMERILFRCTQQPCSADLST